MVYKFFLLQRFDILQVILQMLMIGTQKVIGLRRDLGLYIIILAFNLIHLDFHGILSLFELLAI